MIVKCSFGARPAGTDSIMESTCNMGGSESVLITRGGRWRRAAVCFGFRAGCTLPLPDDSEPIISSPFDIIKS